MLKNKYSLISDGKIDPAYNSNIDFKKGQIFKPKENKEIDPNPY